MGVRRDESVVLMMPNGPEAATAFLAVSSAAVCAPLNPSYTQKEFEFYLSDLKAKALIVQGPQGLPVVVAAEGLGIPIIELKPESDREAGLFTLNGTCFGGGSGQGYLAPAAPDDVALLLHTSGTTSRPKIVPLTQKNLSLSALSIARSLELGSEDTCLNVMPLFHIHGLLGALLSSVSAGAAVACSSGFDPERFFATLEELEPTWYTAVPTMHQAVLASASDFAVVVKRSRLRFIRSCSASLPPQIMRSLEETFNVPVVEAYGMTECSHQISVNPLPPGMRKAGSVGRATGPEVAIMAPDGNLLGAEVTGEIVIRGGMVTGGYRDNPKANGEAFVNGWFRTGDQGRMDSDGYIYITGRIKEIINRGGEKISPREIDEALLEHPDVKQAACFAVPHAKLGEDVAAAVVLVTGSHASEAVLRGFLSERLAGFKVPTRIIILDEIPKGPTGKVRRIELAEQLKDKLTVGFDHPDTYYERMLAGIWSAVLGAERVGRHDNFFQLGGDSLQATRVIVRISREFNVDLPMRSIFESPTIEGLAVTILVEQASKAEGVLVEVEGLSEKEAEIMAGAVSWPGRTREVREVGVGD